MLLFVQDPQVQRRYRSAASFSLSDLSSIFLGRQMDKNSKVRLGNWEREDLNYEKIKYACTDGKWLHAWIFSVAFSFFWLGF